MFAVAYAMRDIWYGDRRDLVKWGVLVELAARHDARHILQVLYPRWTVQIRPFMVTAKAAISSERSRLSQFYFTPFAVGKSAWTFVRQLRGPHLSTCA
jgi:hypothetical protein